MHVSNTASVLRFAAPGYCFQYTCCLNHNLCVSNPVFTLSPTPLPLMKSSGGWHTHAHTRTHVHMHVPRMCIHTHNTHLNALTLYGLFQCRLERSHVCPSGLNLEESSACRTQFLLGSPSPSTTPVLPCHSSPVICPFSARSPYSPSVSNI